MRAVPLLHESFVKFGNHRDLGGVHASLGELALLALTSGQPEQCARLLGAATLFPGHPNDVHVYERSVETTKAILSETAFAAAWQAGQELSWEDVVAEVETFALTVTEPAIDARPLADLTTSYGLTRREQQVLRLLAEGHTNRAIANVLSISERTVEGHVLHILTKLDLPSRAAAAAFAVRHGLA
jgi:non-specific serine/threonine protein kinase